MFWLMELQFIIAALAMGAWQGHKAAFAVLGIFHALYALAVQIKY